MDGKPPEPMRTLLRQKLVDSWEQPLPRLTSRDTWIPRIRGKTLAVIGMRRSGKTSLLWQEVARRVREGAERSWLPMVPLEDERLLADNPGVELHDELLDTYFQLQPHARQPGPQRGYLFLDEIQRIPGWEGFVRRVMDNEPIGLVVSGSSTEMLFAEIASPPAVKGGGGRGVPLQHPREPASRGPGTAAAQPALEQCRGLPLSPSA